MVKIQGKVLYGARYKVSLIGDVRFTSLDGEFIWCNETYSLVFIYNHGEIVQIE